MGKLRISQHKLIFVSSDIAGLTNSTDHDRVEQLEILVCIPSLNCFSPGGIGRARWAPSGKGLR